MDFPGCSTNAVQKLKGGRSEAGGIEISGLPRQNEVATLRRSFG
jgi:hypothetical protein